MLTNLNNLLLHQNSHPKNPDIKEPFAKQQEKKDPLRLNTTIKDPLKETSKVILPSIKTSKIRDPVSRNPVLAKDCNEKNNKSKADQKKETSEECRKKKRFEEICCCNSKENKQDDSKCKSTDTCKTEQKEPFRLSQKGSVCADDKFEMFKKKVQTCPERSATNVATELKPKVCKQEEPTCSNQQKDTCAFQVKSCEKRILEVLEPQKQIGMCIDDCSKSTKKEIKGEFLRFLIR